MKTPILLLIFNRPDTTEEVFAAIREANPERLYVASDGPRADPEGEAERCARARRIATDVDWPCELQTLFRDENLGCRRAVTGAVTWFFENDTSAFNRAYTIAEAILSVRGQSHGHVEHIVQDGGSTDGMLAVLEAYSTPAMLVESVRDGGIYYGTNRGLARATGDVIGLMHSDDLFGSLGSLLAKNCSKIGQFVQKDPTTP